MPEPVQTPIQAQSLADFFQIKGGLSLQLDDTVVPVVILGAGDPIVPGTVESGGGQVPGRQAFGFVNQGGVAAQNGHLQLFNPADSGLLIHLSGFQFGVGAGGAGNINFGFFDTALTTLAAAPLGSAFLDRRETGGPVAQLRSQTNAGLLFAIILGAIRTLADQTTFVNLVGVVLEPGQGFCIEGTVVNVTVDAWFSWGESSQGA